VEAGRPGDGGDVVVRVAVEQAAEDDSDHAHDGEACRRSGPDPERRHPAWARQRRLCAVTFTGQ